MSIIRDEFWQYANEAFLSAYGPKTEKDKDDFLDLARTLTQAALVEWRSLVDRDTTVSAA
jgi:hypothetical protein